MTDSQPDVQRAEEKPRRARSLAIRDIVRVVTVVVCAVVVLYLLYLLRKPIGWIVLAAFIATAVSGPVRLLRAECRIRRRWRWCSWA